jgi:hypothetical protein
MAGFEGFLAARVLPYMETWFAAFTHKAAAYPLNPGDAFVSHPMDFEPLDFCQMSA